MNITIVMPSQTLEKFAVTAKTVGELIETLAKLPQLSGQYPAIVNPRFIFRGQLLNQPLFEKSLYEIGMVEDSRLFIYPSPKDQKSLAIVAPIPQAAAEHQPIAIDEFSGIADWKDLPQRPMRLVTEYLSADYHQTISYHLCQAVENDRPSLVNKLLMLGDFVMYPHAAFYYRPGLRDPSFVALHLFGLVMDSRMHAASWQRIGVLIHKKNGSYELLRVIDNDPTARYMLIGANSEDIVRFDFRHESPREIQVKFAKDEFFRSSEIDMTEGHAEHVARPVLPLIEGYKGYNWHPLFRYLGLLRNLIKATGPNYFYPNKHSDSFLISVVKLGWLEGVKLLVEAGADLEFRNDKGRTALFIAASKAQQAGNKYPEICRYLINHKAQINLQDRYGNIPDRLDSDFHRFVNLTLVNLIGLGINGYPDYGVDRCIPKMSSHYLLHFSHYCEQNDVFRIYFKPNTSSGMKRLQFQALLDVLVSELKDLQDHMQKKLFFGAGGRPFDLDPLHPKSNHIAISLKKEFAIYSEMSDKLKQIFQSMMLPQRVQTPSLIIAHKQRFDFQMIDVLLQAFRLISTNAFLDLQFFDLNNDDPTINTDTFLDLNPKHVYLIFDSLTPENSKAARVPDHKLTHLLQQAASDKPKDNKPPLNLVFVGDAWQNPEAAAWNIRKDHKHTKKPVSVSAPAHSESHFNLVWNNDSDEELYTGLNPFILPPTVCGALTITGRITHLTGDYVLAEQSEMIIDNRVIIFKNLVGKKESGYPIFSVFNVYNLQLMIDLGFARNHNDPALISVIQQHYSVSGNPRPCLEVFLPKALIELIMGYLSPVNFQQQGPSAVTAPTTAFATIPPMAKPLSHSMIAGGLFKKDDAKVPAELEALRSYAYDFSFRTKSHVAEIKQLIKTLTILLDRIQKYPEHKIQYISQIHQAVREIKSTVQWDPQVSKACLEVISALHAKYCPSDPEAYPVF